MNDPRYVAFQHQVASLENALRSKGAEGARIRVNESYLMVLATNVYITTVCPTSAEGWQALEDLLIPFLKGISK